MRSLLLFPAVVLLAQLISPAQAIINTVAGNGNPGFSGDNGPATAAQLGTGFNESLYVAADAAGNFYITDVGNARIRKVNAAGIITTLAQTPCNGAVSFDTAGNAYVASGAQIKKITPSGSVTVIAGGILPGFGGDGGPASSAVMFPVGVVLDSANNIYIADSLNQRIRKIDAVTQIITTVAGTGTAGFSGDNGPAKQATLRLPQGLAADTAGNVYFADGGARIRKIDAATQIITTVAGNGNPIGVIENVPATGTGLATVSVAVDTAGNIYYSDIGRIRKVNTAGLVSTIAGVLPSGFSGDGGPATQAQFSSPTGVAVDTAANVYVVDSINKRIRKITNNATAGPAMSASPTQLLFNGGGGANPISQSLNITSTATAFSFTVTVATVTGGNWLTATPSGNSIAVSANPAGLAAGAYSGSVIISASGLSNSPLTIPVTLTVPAANTGGTPIVSKVLNATGYQDRLAPGAIFVIFGGNLAADGLVTAQSPNYPGTLNGTSVTFAPPAGGAETSARMVYTTAGQIAGQLPSSVAPGTYAVRVTRAGVTSPPINVRVVPRSFGIATANSAGFGPAQATIGNVNGGISLVRYTTGTLDGLGRTYTLSPAHPGDTLVFWGTGGGADATNDTGGSSGDQTAVGNFAVVINGRTLVPAYSGTSFGYPGLWQINVQLPLDLQPDCFASVVVYSGAPPTGEAGNTATIAIAPPGQPACVDPNFPPPLLSKLDANQDLVLGVFGMSRFHATDVNFSSETVSGAVLRVDSAKYALSFSGPKFGACQVLNDVPQAGKGSLDAGASLTLTNAADPPFIISRDGSGESVSYVGFAQTTFRGGRYSLSAGGGQHVGAFSTSTIFPTSFTVTNWDAITFIDRASPLTLVWSGTGFEFVSLTVLSNTPGHSVAVSCDVPAGPGRYTIPKEALAYLNLAGTTGDNVGTITALARSTPGTFEANLTSGGKIDMGLFGATLGVTKKIAVR